MVRAFIAVEVSPALREKIDAALQPLKRLHSGIRWVETENLHLTLRFLGEIEDEQVRTLEELMQARFRGATAPSVRLAGIGRFPEGGSNPRVLWVGVHGDIHLVRSLWERAQTCAKELGLGEDDHAFTPHITIGRVKTRDNIDRVLKELQLLKSAEFGSQTFDPVVLFQSVLSRAGPAYTPLYTISLADRTV
jgi:2'-5' RNA ligase